MSTTPLAASAEGIRASGVAAPPGRLDDALTWTPLGYFCVYRLVVAAFFALSAATGYLLRPLGSHDLGLFLFVAWLYLGFGLVAAALQRIRRPAFTAQVMVQIFVDIAAATVLMHASGGIGSGLGVFLIVTIAAGGLLLPGRTALLFAALATLAILAEQARWSLLIEVPSAQYTQAGVLGVALFATAAAAFELANRARRSASLAHVRALELADLNRLNERIVERMQSGILVLAGERVLLANRAANELLGTRLRLGSTLAQAAPELLAPLDAVRSSGAGHTDISAGQRHLRVSVSTQPQHLHSVPTAVDILFIEDAAALRQQAQLLKMASLGTLTASIAHELRNPIAALTHAAQLLAEDPGNVQENQRLADIIRRHSARLNRIFTDVLELGRRQEVRTELFDLAPWLSQFADDYRTTRGLEPRRLTLRVESDRAVRFDPGHLQQVLWNLCDNALNHVEDAEITMTLGWDCNYNRPFLEVADNGAGIPEEQRDAVFEPFFSRGKAGTGLGLYLARELCETNQATLTCEARPGYGACFRIAFADPRRRQMA